MTGRLLMLTSAPRMQGWSSNTFVAELQKRYDVTATYWISSTKNPNVDPTLALDLLCVDDVGAPDIIIIERWVTQQGEPRIPMDWLAKQVAEGAQALLLNVEPDRLEPNPGAGLFPIAWALPEQGGEHIRGHDRLAAIDNNPWFIWCNASEMWGVERPYLRASYEGLRGVGVASPCALVAAGDILATTPRTTRQVSNLDVFEEPGLPMIWAHARPLGLGHVVSIAGGLTQDSVLEKCPDNSRWLLQLLESLASHSVVLGKPPSIPSGPLSGPLNTTGFDRFMSDDDSEDLADRWEEARFCLDSGATLASIIMLGGVLEGVLGGLLKTASASDLATKGEAPKTNKGVMKPMSQWTLEDRIKVARNLCLIDQSSADHADRARDYRNHAHPGKGRLNKFTARDARRIAELVNEVCDELRISVAASEE